MRAFSILKPKRAAEPPRRRKDEVKLWLGVHDSTRLEWTAALPLPQSGDEKYELDFSVEVPANIYSSHNVWDHKQSFTRLQSPTEEGQLQIDRADIDELRRDTLGVAHRLKQGRSEFERVCTAATAQVSEALQPDLVKRLSGAIDAATAVVAEMRTCLEAPSEKVERDVQHEWRLADEFLSHQLLDFFGQAQKTVDEMLAGTAARRGKIDPTVIDKLRTHLGDALGREFDYRRAHGMLTPEATSTRELSEFVARASQLKKHFQDVLFLDVEAYMLDLKLRNWTGVIAACLAAAFWLSFTLLPIGPGTRFGLSLGTFGMLFAVAYALKDRLKELARGWLAGRIVRMYGQRMVALRLPARVDSRRPEIIEVRETFDCEAQTREDLLNRTVGRTFRVMILRYVARGEMHAQESLNRASITSCKHIFRYDLSPIFSRLDNAVKQVPVLDPEARRVRFVEAPKEYRLSVKLVAHWAGKAYIEEAVLIVSKRGIERIEPVSVPWAADSNA